MQLNQRLNRLLFLELNRDKAAELFQAPSLGQAKGPLYVPIAPSFLVEEIQNGRVPKDLPVTEFISGAALALGADPQFTYASDYRAMLKGFPDAEGHIKHQVKMLLAEEAGESTKDAFLLLKGLCDALPSKATETLLLSIGEDLVLSSEEYGDEVLALAEKAKANQNPMGWLICGSLFHQRGEDEKALRDLREYLSLGGEATDEVTGLLEMLERNQKAERAYELLAEDPAQALVSFNELRQSEGTNPRLIYAMAVAHRLLGNYEKAIFYLEEAQSLDPEYMDVLHELGLNYALLEDFATAKAYFQTVYDAGHELGPMTNLIIALYEIGEVSEAEYLFLKAMEAAPQDDILLEIDRVYRKKVQGSP